VIPERAAGADAVPEGKRPADLPPPPKRDNWDKLAIILQPVGGLLTALAVAILGFWTSSYLREREQHQAIEQERLQTRDTNARLYSELTSRREEAESALRKDMFTSIINSFLREGPATIDQKLLNLELLVYNFNDSLDLKPLFDQIGREIPQSAKRAEYAARLERMAEEIIKKQMIVIQEGGDTFDATVSWKTLTFDGGGAAVAKDLTSDGLTRNFKLEILAADPESKQIQLRVTVRGGQREAAETTSAEFWLGPFDFPMIDNVRLPHDRRMAAVLNNFDSRSGSADLTLAYFPGKYAGLREKPYYDEVLANLLAANQTAAASAPARTPTK
jgi:hypothetical protein